MVLKVLAEVAALAAFAPEATFTADTPPTKAIVAATEPGPIAVTSPVNWVIALDDVLLNVFQSVELK